MTGFRGRLEGILKTAVEIVALGRGVTGSVRLSTGLNPDESVDEIITSVGGGADTESSALEVAPVTLFDLGGGLDTVAA